jgi:hypothetical protein
MLANFLNLAFNSCPSDNTSCFAGFVELTGFELEPLETDSFTIEGLLNDSANVA